MRNPFPALIAYLAIITVLHFPLICLIILIILCLVGWVIALRELMDIHNRL